MLASPGDLLYVTPGSPPGGWLLPDDRSLYGEWRPQTHERLTGYMISRWSDGAETQTDAYFDWFAHRPQQVLADRAWGGPRQGGHFDFENRTDRLGPPPGVAAPPARTVRLDGAPYGSGPPYGGSDATFDKAFDGDPATAYDYEKADGGYAGIDLTVENGKRFRWLRYVSPPGCFGNAPSGRGEHRHHRVHQLRAPAGRRVPGFGAAGAHGDRAPAGRRAAGRDARRLPPRRRRDLAGGDGGHETHGAAATAVPAALTAAVDPATLVVADGKPATATLRVTSAAGRPLDAGWTVQAPAGVTLTPAKGTIRVAPGGTATQRITVAPDGGPGVHAVPIRLSARAAGEAFGTTARLRVSVPAAAFDNVGTTGDGGEDPAGLNGGMSFTWPAAAPGAPDNALADGQTIAVGRRGGRLGLLTVGTYGPIGGKGTVRYTDGTTQEYSVTDPDWQVPSLPPDADPAVTMPYHNLAGTGRVDRKTYVFFHGVDLDPSKTVASVNLPAVSSTARGGVHVFAMAVS